MHAGYYLDDILTIYTCWSVRRDVSIDVSSPEAEEAAPELPMQSKQQVAHVLGWALYKIAMALCAKVASGDRTSAQQRLCDAIDAVQLDSALEAGKSADADYYRYSLNIQKVDHALVRKGLRYVRLPVVEVFYLVERVCIVHFDPRTVTRDSYMRAQRQGLTLIHFCNDGFTFWFGLDQLSPETSRWCLFKLKGTRVQGPARREIENSPEILLAWDTALFELRIQDVTKDSEGDIVVPEGVRTTYRDLFTLLMYRYLHVWQGEFIKKHKAAVALKKQGPLRNVLKTHCALAQKKNGAGRLPVPRPPSSNIDNE